MAGLAAVLHRVGIINVEFEALDGLGTATATGCVTGIATKDQVITVTGIDRIVALTAIDGVIDDRTAIRVSNRGSPIDDIRLRSAINRTIAVTVEDVVRHTLNLGHTNWNRQDYGGEWFKLCKSTRLIIHDDSNTVSCRQPAADILGPRLRCGERRPG